MARDEEVMKALRLAKAHCPSTHLEDTQAWQAGGTKRRRCGGEGGLKGARRMRRKEGWTSVGIRADARSRGGDTAHDRELPETQHNQDTCTVRSSGKNEQSRMADQMGRWSGRETEREMQWKRTMHQRASGTPRRNQGDFHNQDQHQALTQERQGTDSTLPGSPLLGTKLVRIRFFCLCLRAHAAT